MVKNGEVRRAVETVGGFNIWEKSPNHEYRINLVAHCGRTDQGVVIRARRLVAGSGQKKDNLIDKRSVLVIVTGCRKGSDPTVVSVRSLSGLRRVLQDIKRGVYKESVAA